MDWIKAKSIILLLLAAFNLFLLTNIVIYVTSQGISGDVIKNTEKILENRGVVLECNIPRFTRDMPRLEYGSGKYDKKLIASKLLGNNYQNEGKIDGNDTFKEGNRTLAFKSGNSFSYVDLKPGTNINPTEDFIREYFSKTGLLKASYILDEYNSMEDGSSKFVFIEKYKGYLVFDNYFIVYIDSNGVLSLDAGYRPIIDLAPASDNVKGIVLAYQVLLASFDSSRKVTITEINFGYRGAADQEQQMIESSRQSPVWRIKVKESDKPLYFSMSDGKEIK